MNTCLVADMFQYAFCYFIAEEDFLLENEIILVHTGSAASLVLRIKLDAVALEPDETFGLGLSTAIPVPKFGENCFFVDVLNVTIEDREGRQDDNLFPQSKQPTLASATICRY